MTEKTQILPDKVRAYLTTDYRIPQTRDDIVLTIGQRSERLADLFAVSCVSLTKTLSFGSMLVPCRN